MGKTSVELLIFDLDGTLIESKWDIAASVNFTLAELGLPQRPIEEIFGFVGDGVKQLLRLSVGESSQVTFDEALRVFRRQYLAHCLDRTTFYPGIGETLDTFRKQAEGGRHEQVDRIHQRDSPRAGWKSFSVRRRRRLRVWIETGAGHAVACDGAAERIERTDGARRGQHQ